MDIDDLKAQILLGTQNIISMGTEAELIVFAEFLGLHLMKASFMRQAFDLGLTEEGLKACQLDIEARNQGVLERIKILDECNANSLQSLTTTKH